MSNDIERRIESLEQRLSIRMGKPPLVIVAGLSDPDETVEQALARMDPADLNRGPIDAPIIFVHFGPDPALQH